MKMKTNKLGLAIATGVASMFIAGYAVAEGDSRIHIPANESSVTVDHADVWFIADTNADGYTVDLVGFAEGKRCYGSQQPNADAMVAGLSSVAYVAAATTMATAEGTLNTAATTYGTAMDADTIANSTVVAIDTHTALDAAWLTAVIGLTTAQGVYAGVLNASATSIAPADIVYEKTMFFDKDDTAILCGEETVNTLGLTGDLPAADLHLCKWTTPVLSNGNYMINVNSYKFGSPSGSGIRNLGCGSRSEIDGVTLTNNSASKPMSYNTTIDKYYQAFSIAVDAGSTSITQKPSKVELLLPAWGAAITKTATTQTKLEFRDPSPEQGKALWYEVWIYDKAGDRIVDYDDNLGYPNWFKIAVDASELDCNVNANNTRTCSIKIKGSAEIEAAAPGDEFTWWVRANNEELGSGLWSAKGMFKAD